MSSRLGSVKKRKRLQDLVACYGLDCFWCGVKTRPELRHQAPGHWLCTTIDHLVPLSRGGGNEFGNLVIACYRCNIGRGDMIYTPARDSEKRKAA